MNTLATDELADSECRAVLSSAPVMLRRLDARQRCTWSNSTWSAFCGRASHELDDGGWLDSVHPEDRARVLTTMREAARTADGFVLRYRLRHAAGQYRWVEDCGTPLSSRESFTGHIVSCTDVSAIRQHEEDLQHQVAAERERRQEYAHRVKNTLQLIISALRLEARCAGEEGGRLVQAADRIHAIVRVQERLEQLQSSQQECVDVGTFLAEIAAQALDGQSTLTLQVDAPHHPILIAPRRASTLGLIVTEAVFNAIKHAQPHGATRIHLCLRRQEVRLSIELSDDGPGFPQETLLAGGRSGSMGLLLFRSLAAQAEAQVQLSNRSGAVVSLSMQCAAA